MHREHDFGEGFDTEVTKGKKRLDALKVEGRKATVKELKPDNPRQRRNGRKQLDIYGDELLKDPDIDSVDKILETYPPYGSTSKP